MKVYKIFIGTLILIMTSCDYNDSRLVIQNNSKDTIVFDYALDTIPENRRLVEIDYILEKKISPYKVEQQHIRGIADFWGIIIEKSNNNKLNLFVFKRDDVINYDWDTIIIRRMYKRYSLTEKELEDCNWIIKHTPC